MTTNRLFVAGLLLTASFAFVPSAEAADLPPVGIQPPPQCVTQPCCFAPCPPPCDGCEPDPVRCKETAVATTQFFAYLGPHAGVALHSDCTVDAWEAGIVCPSLAPEKQVLRPQAGPVGVSAEVCAVSLVCTCPPVLAPLKLD